MTGAGVPVDLLVVDAASERHRSYQDLLGGLVRQVVTVPPGEEARALARTGDFAAVVMRIDGDDADEADPEDLALSREVAVRTPVVVVAAREPRLQARDAPRSDSLVYVPARFVGDLLAARVSCLIEVARAKAELEENQVRIETLASEVRRLDGDVAEERRSADRLRAQLGEQIHRSKNLLAILQSVAHRTISDGRSVAEIRDTLMGRFRSVARAYQMIVSAGGQGIALADAVGAQLADIADRVTISGPPVRLAGPVAQTFMLALHELANNARRHGALRSSAGTVSVGWAFFETGADRYLELVWKEHGGEPAAPPVQYGFGLMLVSSFARGGAPTPSITFDGEGLTCRLRLSPDMIADA